jgi:ligand-binding sensor domain-containing protein
MNTKYKKFIFRIFLISLFILVLGCTNADSEKSNKSSAPSSTQTVETSRKYEFTPFLIETDMIQENGLTEIKDCDLGNQIQSIVFSSPSEIWTSGPRNITQWDLPNNKTRIFVNNSSCTPGYDPPILVTITDGGELIAGISGKGLYKWENQTWKNISSINEFLGKFIPNLLATSDGKLWVDSYSIKPVSSEEARLLAFDSQELVGPPLISQKDSGFSRIVEGPNNSIIILTQNTGYPTYFNQAIISKANELSVIIDTPPSNEYFTSAAVGPDEEIWLTSNKRLFFYDNNKWKSIPTPWSKAPGSPEAFTSAVDKNGVVWFGLSFNPQVGLEPYDKCGYRDDDAHEVGVYSFDGKKWKHYTVADGLVDNKICTIAVSPDGSVWFGSFDKGLSRFDGKTWKTFSIE